MALLNTAVNRSQAEKAKGMARGETRPSTSSRFLLKGHSEEFPRWCTIPWNKWRSSPRISANNNPITSTPLHTVMSLYRHLYAHDAA